MRFIKKELARFPGTICPACSACFYGSMELHWRIDHSQVARKPTKAEKEQGQCGKSGTFSSVANDHISPDSQYPCFAKEFA